jgi:hypothetical protein
MGKAKAGAASLGDTLKANTAAMATAAGAALVAFGVQSVKAFQDTALEAGKVSEALGINVEDASRLREVSGDLGTKMGTYEKNGETKTVVEHSINNPQLITHKADESLKGPLGGFLTGAEKTALLTNTDNAPF